MNRMMQRSKENLKNKKGFTLIELIVVIAILGILAAVLIPRFSGFTERANETQALVSAKQVATAYDAWYAENNDAWPADATALAAAETEVADMSSVPAADFVLETDGGLVVTQDGYSAGRADGDSEIAASN